MPFCLEHCCLCDRTINSEFCFKVQLTNAHESNEAMIEEISEHDEMISIHEFKEVLHELVKDAVDKIVMKKADIVGKLKTAKPNLIGHDGEATGRDPQQSSRSRCGLAGCIRCIQGICKQDPSPIDCHEALNLFN